MNKKLYSKLSKFVIAIMIASSFNGVVYASDGDIYNASNVKIGSVGNIILNGAKMLDLIMNIKTYGYEAGGKIYNTKEVSDEFAKTPSATMETVTANIKARLISKGDVPIVTVELTPKQIMAKYGNSVVYIEVSDINHKVTASGSGFIVSSSGSLVTNFHVIKDCAYATAILQNGTKYDVKSVLNYSESQDIAILQLSNASNLSTVNLGDSSKVETGDNVVAIGSPLGYENTLSTGIISGLNRKSTRGTDFQTTASFTHGSSGGALFDMYGNVIGITYGIIETVGDLGFVIPINEVKPFLSTSNEKTLIVVNNIQAVKFFPQLSDLPQPTSVNYYKSSTSSESVFYYYSASSIPSNFYTEYFSLLTKNGWIFYESGTDAWGKPYTRFINGKSSILIGWIGNDVDIMGTIH